MYQFPTAPRSITAVVKDSVHLYKKVFGKVVWVSIILAMIVALFGVPVVLLGESVATQPVFSSLQKLVLGLSTLSYAFFLLLLLSYIKGALLWFEGQISQSREVSYRSAALYVLRKYLILVVTSIVIFFAVVFGLVLLIIPGLFLSLLFMFAGFGILLEGDDVFSSIKRSAKIVWGNWWRTFAVLLFPMIVNVIIVLLFRLVAKHLLHLDITHFGYHILVAIPVVFLAPWSIAVSLEQYYDLKLRYQRKS